MIKATEIHTGIGRVERLYGRDLGELVGGTAAQTAVPQAQQTDSPTARHTNRKGALAMTMPWARPLRTIHHAVQCATASRAGGA